ncbi:hypothetical protein Hanom_Chr05g00410551 [Helianthus anomalus]
MKEEITTANMGIIMTMARLDGSTTFENYKRIEIKREKDPSTHKKPKYDQLDFPIKTLVKRSKFPSERNISKAARNFLKRKFEKKNEARKEDLVDTTMGRHVSLNSSAITLVPKNPPGLKILKWKSNKDTFELTLLRANGKVQKISIKSASGLRIFFLQDLISLQLERALEDTDSMNFK